MTSWGTASDLQNSFFYFFFKRLWMEHTIKEHNLKKKTKKKN